MKYALVIFLMSLSFLAGSFFSDTLELLSPQPTIPMVTIEGSLPALSRLCNDDDELSDEERDELTKLILKIESYHLGMMITEPVQLDFSKETGTNDLLTNVLYQGYRQYQHAQINCWRGVGKEYQTLLMFRSVRQYEEDAQYEYDAFSITELDAIEYVSIRRQEYLKQIANYTFKIERDMYLKSIINTTYA